LGGHLRKQGYQITLLDCLDRSHPIYLKSQPNYRPRADGTGHFIKEILSKPPSLTHVPRRYGRYGLPFETVRQILKKRPPPDVIALTSGMTYWYPGVFEMITLCRSTFPGVPVVLGGLYATLCTDHARNYSGADSVVPGPLSQTSLDLFAEITGFQPQASISELVLPAYDLYPSLRTAAIRTMIGCPFRCPFCASHLLSGAFQVLNPDIVMQQIGYLAGRRDVQDIAFYDDALLLNRENHLIPILLRIIEEGVSCKWHTPNGLHPRWVDGDLARLLARSGFKTLRLSYESTSPDRQKAMGKKVTDADLNRAVTHLKSAGFTSNEIGAYVLMGLPGQSLDEVVETLFFVLGLNIRVSLASFSPIPGTESWEEAVALGLIPQDLDPLLTNNSIFPMVPEPHIKERLIRLGTLAARANQMVVRGKAPLRNDNWRREVQKLLD
jgi:radical SAM superfamily enzyme YgiQ (UPF0313 family)